MNTRWLRTIGEAACVVMRKAVPSVCALAMLAGVFQGAVVANAEESDGSASAQTEQTTDQNQTDTLANADEWDPTDASSYTKIEATEIREDANAEATAPADSTEQSIAARKEFRTDTSNAVTGVHLWLDNNEAYVTRNDDGTYSFAVKSPYDGTSTQTTASAKFECGRFILPDSASVLDAYLLEEKQVSGADGASWVLQNCFSSDNITDLSQVKLPSTGYEYNGVWITYNGQLRTRIAWMGKIGNDVYVMPYDDTKTSTEHNFGTTTLETNYFNQCKPWVTADDSNKCMLTRLPSKDSKVSIAVSFSSAGTSVFRYCTTDPDVTGMSAELLNGLEFVGSGTSSARSDGSITYTVRKSTVASTLEVYVVPEAIADCSNANVSAYLTSDNLIFSQDTTANATVTKKTTTAVAADDGLTQTLTSSATATDSAPNVTKWDNTMTIIVRETMTAGSSTVTVGAKVTPEAIETTPSSWSAGRNGGGSRVWARAYLPAANTGNRVSASEIRGLYDEFNGITASNPSGSITESSRYEWDGQNANADRNSEGFVTQLNDAINGAALGNGATSGTAVRNDSAKTGMTTSNTATYLRTQSELVSTTSLNDSVGVGGTVALVSYVDTWYVANQSGNNKNRLRQGSTQIMASLTVCALSTAGSATNACAGDDVTSEKVAIPSWKGQPGQSGSNGLHSGEVMTSADWQNGTQCATQELTTGALSGAIVTVCEMAARWRNYSPRLGGYGDYDNTNVDRIAPTNALSSTPYLIVIENVGTDMQVQVNYAWTTNRAVLLGGESGVSDVQTYLNDKWTPTSGIYSAGWTANNDVKYFRMKTLSGYSNLKISFSKYHLDTELDFSYPQDTSSSIQAAKFANEDPGNAANEKVWQNASGDGVYCVQGTFPDSTVWLTCRLSVQYISGRNAGTANDDYYAAWQPLTLNITADMVTYYVHYDAPESGVDSNTVPSDMTLGLAGVDVSTASMQVNYLKPERASDEDGAWYFHGWNPHWCSWNTDTSSCTVDQGEVFTTGNGYAGNLLQNGERVPLAKLMSMMPANADGIMLVAQWSQDASLQTSTAKFGRAYTQTYSADGGYGWTELSDQLSNYTVDMTYIVPLAATYDKGWIASTYDYTTVLQDDLTVSGVTYKLVSTKTSDQLLADETDVNKAAWKAMNDLNRMSPKTATNPSTDGYLTCAMYRQVLTDEQKVKYNTNRDGIGFNQVSIANPKLDAAQSVQHTGKYLYDKYQLPAAQLSANAVEGTLTWTVKDLYSTQTVKLGGTDGKIWGDASTNPTSTYNAGDQVVITDAAADKTMYAQYTTTGSIYPPVSQLPLTGTKPWLMKVIVPSLLVAALGVAAWLKHRRTVAASVRSRF
ncbi:hypothetical protein [Bifidobacterium eulemuris]|uniref:Uncharacterized protein n=1 Tax=Bifidobacterium eulemuris TaxID=1765219 RepID=A0A261GA34_9BIFI|nr:hypothetical protein [Bifidobacterium eulemuris]OZG68297.1 hypothetical protein BEUL_1310 [Bifidobacterium eulemuris]QOL31651.1 hypothetical protein BE0216_03635 [Bifidobacterium eulemuris]